MTRLAAAAAAQPTVCRPGWTEATTMSRACATVTGNRQPAFFLGSGQPISKQDFLQKLSETTADVICLGENHADRTAHALELEILALLHGAGASLALSLEFYQREAQIVLDEYLAGLVPLDTFLADSRPPANHTDYQGLLDYCKTAGLPAIAANCPRRYTRAVAKHGKDFLLAKVDVAVAGGQASRLLPPLPYASASAAYRNKFLAVMGRMGNSGANVATNMLDAQSLWDATMAHSIATGLQKVNRILHITGHFHIQHRLGTVEHLKVYCPHAQVLTVAILPSDDTVRLAEEHLNVADLVVLTDVDALD